MKILYLDVDGVLRKWNDAAISVLREFWHIPEEDLEPHKKPDQFEWVDAIEKKYPFVGTALFEPSYSSLSLHLRAEPYSYASDLYDFMRRIYNVKILTSQPNEFCAAMTVDWLKRNIRDFDSEVIIRKGSEKHIQVGGAILVDDKAKTNFRVRANGGLAICMDQSWNQEWDGYRVQGDPNSFRCPHWSEIPKIVDEFYDGTPFEPRKVG